MAAINIRNLPDDIYAALKDRASRHGRSVEEEAVECLDAVVSGRPFADVDQDLAALAKFRASLDGFYVAEEDLQNAKRQGRS